MTKKIAVITGGGSGIGAAAAVALAEDGYHVVVAGRRVEKLEEVAARTGGTAIRLDVTDDASVEKFAAQVRELGNVDVLVNNAGGAHGLDTLREANLEDWQVMYDTNVLGVVRVTKALLPLIDAAEGLIINIGSMASFTAYPGGSGYNAAKAGEHMLARALRLELNGEKVRVIEIAPGMVRTEEFSLTRLGDKDAADKVYDGVEQPLTAEDCADVISYALNAPHHVNLDLVTVRPLAQAAAHAVARGKGV